MSNQWVLSGASSDYAYLVVWSKDAATQDTRRRVSPFQACAALEQWLRLNKQSLGEIYDRLGEGRVQGASCVQTLPDDGLIRRRVSEALLSGRLIAIENKPQIGAGAGFDGDAPVSNRSPVPQKQMILRLGVAYRPEGVNLREAPSPDARVLMRLGFNSRVFVDSHDNGWLFVSTDKGNFGYCVASHIDTRLPEPHARVHWVQSGDSALSISHRYYGGMAQWGSDHRFYVEGLVYANLNSRQQGIYKEDPAAGWDTTSVTAGRMIWIPSLAFLKSLRGKVSSESFTYDAWTTAKWAADAVADFSVGTAAFIAGIIHGALESLWDVLVGFKDLAVMLWDILSSLLTGNLLSDARTLWNDVSKTDWNTLAHGWVARFDEQWNDSQVLRRWHFRGWVIGYVLMEALMLFCSGGMVQGIKWVGKSSKASKFIKSLPQVQKLARTVKESNAFQKVARALGKGAPLAENATDAKRWIERLLLNPKRIWGKGPDQIAEVFRQAGYKVEIAPSTKGSRLSKQIQIKNSDIQNIQVHPGGGRHGGSYYKLSTSSKGILKVVDRATYIPTLGEKATIIYVDVGLQGWMLQAATANAAMQNALDELGADGGGDR
ncbi:SH3 domain-containing protein [Corallococcus macrosporus]|uniref:SH3 domain-containing protein n=1 Tax=Corallococcus macrosporus TaxID=35 RepID=A0ABS3DIF4_9BACT|nr:SH3 domain-containing protein [Corallococcus macrosporus]MBN8231112.1 SH3 domain-containing protein [Corallococcus macrosporus]